MAAEYGATLPFDSGHFHHADLSDLDVYQLHTHHHADVPYDDDDDAGGESHGQYDGSMIEEQPQNEGPYEDGSVDQHDEMEDDNVYYDEDESFRRAMIEQAEQKYLQDELRYPTPPPLHDTDFLADPPNIDSIEQILAQERSQGHFQDRWQVDKEAATFLASVMRDVKADVTDEMRYHFPTPLRQLRAEEALLQCDPDSEMRAILERNEVRLTSKGMTPFKLDADKDESLEWGAVNLALPARLAKELGAEKWQVSTETMAFLRNILATDEESLEDWVRREREQKIIRKASPTLLPLSPPWSPSRLPSPIALLPLASTPEDPTVQEAAMLHDEIIGRDEAEAEQAHAAGIEQVGDFLVGDTALLSTPSRNTPKRLQSLKVSSPILPQQEYLASSEPPSKKAKTVAFTDELHTIIPRFSSIDEMTDPEEGAQEAAATIVEMIRPLAKPARDMMASEKLCEVDTTARVPVPAISPIKVTGPWDQLGGQSDVLKDVSKEISEKENRWSGASKLEKSLPWVPFSSHLGKIRPEGDFDDGSCVRYLKELHLDDDLDVQRLTWKPEGLRVLDDDDDDEDDLKPAGWQSDEAEENLGPMEMESVVGGALQPTMLSRPIIAATAGSLVGNEHHLIGTSKQTGAPTPIARGEVRRPETLFSKMVSTISSGKLPSKTGKANADSAPVLSIEEILRQRKAKLDIAAATSARRIAADQEPREGRNSKETPWNHTAAQASAEDPLTDPPLSPANANAMAHFGQFLALQGQPDLPTVESFIDQKANAMPIAPRSNAAPKPPTAVDAPAAPIIPPRPARQVPMPIIEDNGRSFPVVLSSTIMENRYMIRKLEEHLPGLELVVRDHDPPGREADVTISSSTGLMTTNLQKLKQKPLPGQKAIQGIREHLATVGPRYERLIVVVSEGKQALGEESIEVSGLDERDETVLCDFIGTCTLMTETEVQVNYVPGGDEELVRWVAAAISRHGASQGFKLLQEETYWERFLRKAGLNAFAAQVILGQLKVSEETIDSAGVNNTASTPTTQGTCMRPSGLTAFVCLNEEERVQRFGPLLGGEGMLRRASAAMDGRWPSVVSTNNGGASWRL